MSARQALESNYDLALCTQTRMLILDGWHEGCPMHWHLYGHFERSPVELTPPLASVTSIEYVDATGTSQTMAADLYQADLGSARVFPSFGQTWPVVALEPSAIKITYVTGVEPARVPKNIVGALYLLTAHYYKNREQVVNQSGTGRVADLPRGVDLLMGKYVPRYVR